MLFRHLRLVKKSEYHGVILKASKKNVVLRLGKKILCIEKKIKE